MRPDPNEFMAESTYQCPHCGRFWGGVLPGTDLCPRCKGGHTDSLLKTKNSKEPVAYLKIPVEEVITMDELMIVLVSHEYHLNFKGEDRAVEAADSIKERLGMTANDFVNWAKERSYWPEEHQDES